MKYDEFIEKLSMIYSDYYKEKFNPSDNKRLFHDIKNYLTAAYLGNNQVKELIHSNNSDMLLNYFINVLNGMKQKYGKVLFNVNEDLSHAILHKNFNLIYECFKKEFEYHKKYSLAEHASKYDNIDCYIERYNAWTNLLNDYYDSVMNGNFTGIIKLDSNMILLQYINEILNMYHIIEQHNKETSNIK